eukprot:1427315-Prymnesium_polylepis.1
MTSVTERVPRIATTTPPHFIHPRRVTQLSRACHVAHFGAHSSLTAAAAEGAAAVGALLRLICICTPMQIHHGCQKRLIVEPSRGKARMHSGRAPTKCEEARGTQRRESAWRPEKAGAALAEGVEGPPVEAERERCVAFHFGEQK